MQKRLLKGIATVSLLAALPINTAMAAELSTPSVDAQHASTKVVHTNIMPRVMMEYYFDNYAVFYLDKNDIPSSYYMLAKLVEQPLVVPLIYIILHHMILVVILHITVERFLVRVKSIFLS